jgi:hypothetical protein
LDPEETSSEYSESLKSSKGGLGVRLRLSPARRGEPRPLFPLPMVKWRRREREKKVTDDRRMSEENNSASRLFIEVGVAVHFLPRSLNSHKYSISKSSRLKMSQAIDAASRNTTPFGPRSTARAV